MSETDGTEADNPNGVEDAVMNMKVQVGDAVFYATLEENEAVASLQYYRCRRLREIPPT